MPIDLPPNNGKRSKRPTESGGMANSSVPSYRLQSRIEFQVGLFHLLQFSARPPVLISPGLLSKSSTESTTYTPAFFFST
jgi:hypothetical protein